MWTSLMEEMDIEWTDQQQLPAVAPNHVLGWDRVQCLGEDGNERTRVEEEEKSCFLPETQLYD